MRMPARRGRRRGIIIVALVAILLIGLWSARFYTDVLWFQEVGLSSVLFKSLATQFFVGAAVGILVAALVWLNLAFAARVGPAYRVPRSEVIGGGDPLERYRDAVAPYLKWLRLAVAVFVGVLAGLGASSAWQNFLLWANRVDFGEVDPQFGRDIGFYVFELPFLKDVTEYLWFGLIAALVLSAAAHYFHGSLRPEIGLRGLAPAVLAHLSVLLGCLALVKAAQYYLGTFELNFSPRGVVTGASYTDVNAHLPALRLLAIISVISAILFLVNIRFRRLSLPIAAVGIWILTAVLAGALWPSLVQRFSVEPQELQRERPFIQRNLEATNAAFDLADVTENTFPATSELAAEDIETNDSLLENVRVWDPSVLQQAYTQLQAIRTYYEFPDVDIDRYVVDGQMRQILLSAREISLSDLPEESQSWPNLHLQYTHGYGLVASLANGTTSAGQPAFLVKDLPGTVQSGAEALDTEQGQPRIYFGESFEPRDYSVVNTEQAEIDFENEAGVERSNYDGDGGIPVGNYLRRLAFAIREVDYRLMLSGLITNDSKIMLYRDVRDRVLRAAPFLSLDHDPYPAVIDGRIVWILDAYTTTPWYPYSQRFDLTDIVGEADAGTLSGDVNYVRNSVKVAVDAYNGTMDFYIVDESDPLIQTWNNAFPALFSDEEPPSELREHFRYPEDLFMIQSQVFLTYHIDDPDDFYSKADQWALARNVEGDYVVPTYLLISLPGETEQEFVLTRPFTPNQRNNMVALMVARSDPENYGEILSFEFPRTRQVPGPLQVDNLINQDFEISQDLSLLRQGGSDVDFGSLVILPIEDSILYIQPLFVTATDQTGGGIPELKRVVLVFGEEVVMEETFDEALATLFDLEQPPVVAQDEEQPPPDGQPPPDAGPGGAPQGARAELARLVQQAGTVYERAQQALQAGDFETYGRLIDRLGELIARAEGLSQ
jgi:uncharacterized membrane protein (UPF0182 family)